MKKVPLAFSKRNRKTFAMLFGIVRLEYQEEPVQTQIARAVAQQFDLVKKQKDFESRSYITIYKRLKSRYFAEWQILDPLGIDMDLYAYVVEGMMIAGIKTDKVLMCKKVMRELERNEDIDELIRPYREAQMKLEREVEDGKIVLKDTETNETIDDSILEVYDFLV